MNKNEFLTELHACLAGLPEADREQTLSYYAEIIDDRTENGADESEAVAALGSPREVAKQVIDEIPLLSLAAKRVKPRRRLRAQEIVLIALASPIWFSLGVAAFAVVISLLAVIFAVAVSLWTAEVAIATAAPAALVAAFVCFFASTPSLALLLLGSSLVLAGLAVFGLLGCRVLTKLLLKLSKKLLLLIKLLILGKEKRA